MVDGTLLLKVLQEDDAAQCISFFTLGLKSPLPITIRATQVAVHPIQHQVELHDFSKQHYYPGQDDCEVLGYSSLFKIDSQKVFHNSISKLCMGHKAAKAHEQPCSLHHK